MRYTFRQGDLPKLDLEVDKGSDFIAWNAQWKAYRTLSGPSDEEATKQADVLRLCFTRDTLTTINNLGLTQDQENDPVAIIEALRNHVEGQINVTVERRNFRKRKQQLGETFDDFLCSLGELAKTCQFCNDACTRNNIRDQIIEGLNDRHSTRIVERTTPHPSERNHDLPGHGSHQEGSHQHERYIRPEDQPQEDRSQEQIEAETTAIFTSQHEHQAELPASEPR